MTLCNNNDVTQSYLGNAQTDTNSIIRRKKNQPPNVHERHQPVCQN